MVSEHDNTADQNSIERLGNVIRESEAIVIGAGAGLSTSAGYVYAGERLHKYFHDFEAKYGCHDMYSLGFSPFSSMEEFWGFWCRHIWLNRYAPIPSDVYTDLYDLVKDKEYFVLTTNVDHCFQRSGFDKKRLYYMQGDMGLFQSSSPQGAARHKTYDNYEIIRKMVLSEGFEIGEDGNLIISKDADIRMTIPSELVPVCPDDGNLMTNNLRIDDTFVQDKGWYKARDRYSDFLKKHHDYRTLFLELGVGGNTPGIVKYNFWQMTYEWPDAMYACLNYGEASAPEQIENKSICIDGDIGEVLQKLKSIGSRN